MQTLRQQPLATAITLIALTLAGSAAAADSDLAPITIHSTPSNSSEGSGNYTVPAMTGSTGLALSAKETPQSVSVITDQQIKDQNLDTLGKALDSTTGISVQKTDGGRANFSARGFGVGRYEVDGMAVGWNGAWVTGESNLDTVLYDRIEVVRGASGLTTGAGDPSAAVNLVRKHADSHTRRTILAGGIGRYADWNGTIDHTQPFTASGNVRGRVIAHHQGGKTFIDRERVNQDTLYGVIDADLTDSTRLSGGISYQQDKRRAAMWGGLPAFLDDGSLADWPTDKNAAPDWVRWNNKTTNYFLEGSQKIGDDWEVSLKANQRHGQGDSKLFYISGNSVNRADGLGWSASPGKFNVDSKQTNIQLQTSGKYRLWGQTHDFTAGIQYNRRNTTSQAATIDYGNLPAISNFHYWDGSYPEPAWGASSVKYDHTIKENGLYAATRLRVTDRLSVIAGTRVSNWKSEGVSYGTSQDYKTGTVWTPYGGVLYDITPNHTVYASYTDIFKPQQQRDINNKLLDPIRGQSYEAGWKGSFADGALTTQAAVFRTRQDNLAQSTGETIPGTNPAETAYRAAKGATVHGFELEAAGKITPEWQIGTGYSQWRGKDADGDAINTTHPRKQYKLFTTYDMGRFAKGLTVGGGLKWQSRTYESVRHAPTGRTIEYGQKSYALVDLMARYQINDQLSAQLNVENLFNKKYRDQYGWGQYGYGSPRYISAGFRYEF